MSNKVIKLKSKKRSIFIGRKRYFLELPELSFHINYEPKQTVINGYDSYWGYGCGYSTKISNTRYDVGLKVKPKLLLGNLGQGGSEVCLGQSYFLVKDFPNNVIDRFFFSRFSPYFYYKKVNDYFYSQWQKHGLEYHNYFVKKNLDFNGAHSFIGLDDLKQKEKGFLRC